MTTASPTQEVIEQFSSEYVREFMKQNMQHSYLEAILTHHPRVQEISLPELKTSISAFLDELFRRLPKKIYTLCDLDNLIIEFNRKLKLLPFLEEAYRNYRAYYKQKNRFSYLSPYLLGKRWVDIGCGSGQLLNYIHKNHSSSFDALLGIEVGDFQTSDRSFDFLVCDFKNEKPVISRPYDSGMLMSVLHHVSDAEECIVQFLKNLDSLGIRRLVVEEDVLLEKDDLFLPGMQEVISICEKQPKLNCYFQLELDLQKAITSMADYFSNALFGAHEMPFPFSFKSCSHWKMLFEQAGWMLERIHFLGFQKGNFNQVCHALFVLNKE